MPVNLSRIISALINEFNKPELNKINTVLYCSLAGKLRPFKKGYFLICRLTMNFSYQLDSILISKEGVVKEHDRHNQKHNCHTATSFKIIFGLITSGRHHQGVYLVRGQYK